MAKCRLEKNIDGSFVPVINRDGYDRMLGSRYDYRNASDMWISQFDMKLSENMILFGMGDCHIIETSLERLKGNIIVWEPEQTIFSCMEKTVLFGRLKKNYRVQFFSGENEFVRMEGAVRELLNEDSVETTIFTSHPGYMQCFRQEYQTMEQMCQTVCDEIGFMKPSIQLFIDAMIDNQIHNLQYIEHGIPLARLKKYWKPGVPAFLISAGPSLEKNVDELKYVKNRAWICCVDAALPTLLKHDIVPDLVACADAMIPLNWLEDKRSWSIPLLITSNVPRELLRKSKSVKIWAEDHAFIQMLCKGAGIEQPELRSYSSVSTMLFTSLLELGVTEIIFAGQDLAYSEDGKSHVSGRDEGFVQDSQYNLPGYYGGVVWSRGDWNLYHQWFEKSIRFFPHCRFVNATEGGAKIEGTVQSSLKEVVSHLNNVEKDDTFYGKDEVYVQDSEYNFLMNMLKTCMYDLQEIEQMGYEKVFYHTDYKKIPVMRLVIDYMKSLDDMRRNERFREAVIHIRKEFEDLFLNGEK